MDDNRTKVDGIPQLLHQDWQEKLPYLNWDGSGNLAFDLDDSGRLAFPLKPGAEIPTKVQEHLSSVEVLNRGIREKRLLLPLDSPPLAEYRESQNHRLNEKFRAIGLGSREIFESIADPDNPEPIPRSLLQDRPEMAAWLNGELSNHRPTVFEYRLLWPAFIERRRKLRERGLLGSTSKQDGDGVSMAKPSLDEVAKPITKPEMPQSTVLSQLIEIAEEIYLRIEEHSDNEWWLKVVQLSEQLEDLYRKLPGNSELNDGRLPPFRLIAFHANSEPSNIDYLSRAHGKPVHMKGFNGVNFMILQAFQYPEGNPAEPGSTLIDQRKNPRVNHAGDGQEQRKLLGAWIRHWQRELSAIESAERADDTVQVDASKKPKASTTSGEAKRGRTVSAEEHDNRKLVAERWAEFSDTYTKDGKRATYRAAAEWMLDTFEDMEFLTDDLSDPTDHGAIGKRIQSMVRAFRDTPQPRNIIG